MAEMRKPARESTDLRRRAEQRLRKKSAPAKAPSRADDPGRLLHELQVHQVQLEMQNEDLRRSQALLSATVAEYTALYDFAPVGYFTLDRQGHITRANLAGAKLLGHDRASLVGFRFAAFIAGDDCTAFIEILQQAADAQAQLTREIGLVAREDQPPRIALLQARLSPDGMSIQLAAVDVTERKRAERALRASEQQFQQLVQNMSVALVVHGPDGRILFSNPTADRLLGLTLEQLKTKEIIASEWHFVHENGTSMHTSEYPINRVLASGQPVTNFIIGLDRSDAEGRLWVIVNAYPEMDPDHQINRIVVTFSDISERIRAEAALRESYAQYRLLYENIRDAFCRVDMEGHILQCNQAYCAMLGYSSEEISHLTYLDVTPEAWHAMEAEIVAKQVLARGFSDIYEKEYRHKNGMVFPVELRTILTRDATGQPTDMWAIIRDISGRKRTEAALLKSRDQLELHVQKRTAALRKTNERLRALAAKLTAAEEVERLRVARLVHDSFIQTLSLANIRLGSIAQQLAGASLKDERAKVGEIRTLLKGAIQQSRLLVSDLAPPMLYELGLLPALQDLAARLGAEHDIPIRVKADRNFTLADKSLRGLLFQSTRELIINALKHAQASEINISLTKRERGLQISVADCGRGAEASQFAWSKSQATGGFGLFHIRQLVEGLGGRMQIDSVPGDGTCVRISIPLRALRPRKAKPVPSG